MMNDSSYLPGIKIYDEMRTAHVERQSAASSGMRLFYRKKYYDFDEEKAAAVGVTHAGYGDIFKALFQKKLECVELVEPLFLRQLCSLWMYLIAIALGNLFYRRKVLIVAYAIENLPLRQKLKSLFPVIHKTIYPVVKVTLAVTTYRFDRIAFGTEQSRQLYAAIAPRLSERVETTVVEALEPSCSACAIQKTPRSVLFLGAFDERKGVRPLMAAWPSILQLCPGATLELVGKGPLQSEVSKWVQHTDTARLLIDPPRADIHDALAKAAILILLSRSDDSWREQVGLPIVEGLSHGCRIISSAETGLAPWLISQDHLVVTDFTRQLQEVAAFIAMDANPATVTASLPRVSGRASAEEWLWRK